MSEGPTEPEFEAFLGGLLAALAGRLEARVPQPAGEGPWAAASAGVNLLIEELGARIEALERAERERSALLEQVQRAQQNLVRQEKLAVLGELAAGISHEVNNPLTTVLMAMQLVECKLDAARGQGALDAGELDDLVRLLGRAREEGQRIGDITGQVFGLVRPDDEAHVGLDALALRAASLVQLQLQSRVKLVQDVAAVPLVEGDGQRLLQVVLNLLFNARDAVVEGSEPTLWIRTCARAEQVYLVVEDNGPGVPETHRAKVFEPFISTKTEGRSMGLGLHLSRELVEAAGGTLTLDRSPQGGARFQVAFPVAAEGVAAVQPVRTSPSAAPDDPVELRVLLVEDEPALRSAMTRVMAAAGLSVVGAPSGAAALTLLNDDDQWDAVLSDLSMPELDGPRFIRLLEQHHPQLVSRLVVMTGGASTPAAVALVAGGRFPVLHKPMDSKRLIAEIRRVAAEAS